MYSLTQDVIIDNAFAISMLDFWKFAKDCRIPDARLTLAEIDRIFIVADKSEALDQYMDLHNPSKKLIFRQFIEGVVRLADFKYQVRACASLCPAETDSMCVRCRRVQRCGRVWDACA